MCKITEAGRGRLLFYRKSGMSLRLRDRILVGGEEDEQEAGMKRLELALRRLPKAEQEALSWLYNDILMMQGPGTLGKQGERS